jgi:hypothetical protein
LAALTLMACNFLTSDFKLSGVVDVESSLRSHVPKTNAMLFIVAENAGGVPVAVRRIVNPEFPAIFKMGPEDLLVPAVRRRETLRVHAHMNTHGDLGIIRSGDLEGAAQGVSEPGSQGLRIVLNQRH